MVRLLRRTCSPSVPFPALCIEPPLQRKSRDACFTINRNGDTVFKALRTWPVSPIRVCGRESGTVEWCQQVYTEGWCSRHFKKLFLYIKLRISKSNVVCRQLFIVPLSMPRQKYFDIFITGCRKDHVESDVTARHDSKGGRL